MSVNGFKDDQEGDYQMSKPTSSDQDFLGVLMARKQLLKDAYVGATRLDVRRELLTRLDELNDVIDLCEAA